MTVLAGVAVAAEDFEFGRVFAETTTRIDLTQIVPVHESFIPYFWKERGGRREDFERSVRDHPLVADLVDLNGRVNARLYRIEWADGPNGFFDALQDHEIMLEEAATNRGETWIFRLRALHQQALSDFQESCYDYDIPLDIRRIQHNPTEDSTKWSLIGITPKQREALQLAYDRGYFQVPRETSATELGEELGISRQSFSRRLQRAQETIFSNLLDEVGV